MKSGKLAVDNSLIRQYLRQNQARLHTEAIVQYNADVRQTFAALDAGTKTTVTTYVEDAVRITPSNATGISHTTGTDDITDLDSTAPYPLLMWALDESVYGPDLRLAKVQLYLDPQRNTANPPFDGRFVLEILALKDVLGHSGVNDLWKMAEVASSIIVPASSITAAGLVDFTMASSYFGNTPGPVIINNQFVPNSYQGTSGAGLWGINGGVPLFSRVVVLRLRAFPGPSGNTNYSWKYNSATSNPEAVASKGSLFYVSGARPTGYFSNFRGDANNVQVGLGTGIPRATFTVSAFAATGTLAFTGGSQMDLGASPTGTVEFRVLDEVPNGCTGTAYARVNSGDAWVVVKDGYTNTDAALASSQTYEMKYEFAADSTLSASPTLKRLGIVDRVLVDLTEIAGWPGQPQCAVDTATGQYTMGNAECRLQLTGQRDYVDAATSLLADYNWTTIELRTHAYHPDLARSEWGFLDLWKLDSATIEPSEVVLSCVGVMSEMRGNFPAPAGGTYGYLLKSTNSDWTSGLAHTGDFLKEMSLLTQSTSSVSWTVSAGATEYAYYVTPAGVPHLSRWPTGDWSVAINLTSGDSNIKLTGRLLRYNSAKALQETNPKLAYSNGEEITASTGAHTLTFGAIEWLAGSENDRLVLELRARNTDGGASHAITFETGTTATEVRPPWASTKTVTPQQFTTVSPASAYTTWRNTVVGLPARFRGPVSDRAQWLVSKAVMDADGQREGERISYLDGLCQIESQGVIKHANLWGPRANVVAFFPIETYAPGAVSMGFSERIPEYRVGYGFETNVPGDFAGVVKAQHAAAYAAFGVSRVDDPVAELEHETAKYILDPGLAGEIARARVLARGCGKITLEFTPNEMSPWLEIGDAVAVETDRIAFPNPVEAVRCAGPLYAFGLIVQKSGDLLPSFTLEVAGMGDLFVTGDTVGQRTPYEGPKVTASIVDDPNNVQNALAVLRCRYSTATIYYYYAATGTTPPDRNQLHLWSTYSAEITLLRDTTADKVLWAFAIYSGFSGAIEPFRVTSAPAVTIGSLVGSEAGTTVTAVASQVSVAVRRIRWYMRRDAASTVWPTSDGTVTGNMSETYFVAEVAVDTDLGGALSQAHTGQVYGAGDDAQIIAIPIDYNGRRGTRKTATYPYAGAASPTITAATWTANVTTAGASRTVDFAWTPGSVVDVTHDLKIYANDGFTRTLIATQTAPNGSPASSNVAVGYTNGTGEPHALLVYEYELVAGATVITAGYFSPTYGDNFVIGDGTLAV